MTRTVRWLSSRVLFAMATTPKYLLCRISECRPRVWFGCRITQVLEEMNELRLDKYGLQCLLDGRDDEVRELKRRVSDGRGALLCAREALVVSARVAPEAVRVDSAAGTSSPGWVFDEVSAAVHRADEALRGRRPVDEDDDLDTCIF